MTGDSPKMTRMSDMEAFKIANLIEQQQQSDDPYLEFLRVPSMSVGFYVLPSGAVDTQQPHTEDEVYYVVSGQGQIRVAKEECCVQSGSVVFVAAGAKHYFHSITEDLQILVFFAPAEYSNAPYTL
jgi:mannose-6-phosphate isomerase-like protein (cupin superfamily)